MSIFYSDDIDEDNANDNINLSNNDIDFIMSKLQIVTASINMVIYVTNLINTYKNEIIQHGDYTTILSPLIDKYCIGKKNVSPNGVSVVQITNTSDFDNIYYYHLGPNNKSNNLYFKDIKNENFVTNWRKNFKNNPNMHTIHYNNEYSCIIYTGLNGKQKLSIYYAFIMKDVLNPTKYIRVGVAEDMDYLFNNVDDYAKYASPCLSFIKEISTTLNNLNDDNWSSVDTITTIQSVNPNMSYNKCIYSILYPEMNGENTQTCSIMNDKNKKQIMDLFYNYPNLQPEQVAITTHNVNNVNYMSLIRVEQIVHDNKLSYIIKQKDINVNDMFYTIANRGNNDMLYMYGLFLLLLIIVIYVLYLIYKKKN